MGPATTRTAFSCKPRTVRTAITASSPLPMRRRVCRFSITMPPGRRRPRTSTRQLVRRFRGALARAGMMAFSERVGIAGTAHVGGTLVTGKDPTQSVVDPLGQVHGMRSFYVVDGSILPRSSRVNPSLTIYAWALRAAENLARRLKPAAAASARGDPDDCNVQQHRHAQRDRTPCRARVHAALLCSSRLRTAIAAVRTQFERSIAVTVDDMERSVTFPDRAQLRTGVGDRGLGALTANTSMASSAHACASRRSSWAANT